MDWKKINYIDIKTSLYVIPTYKENASIMFYLRENYTLESTSPWKLIKETDPTRVLHWGKIETISIGEMKNLLVKTIFKDLDISSSDISIRHKKYILVNMPSKTMPYKNMIEDTLTDTEELLTTYGSCMQELLEVKDLVKPKGYSAFYDQSGSKDGFEYVSDGVWENEETGCSYDDKLDSSKHIDDIKTRSRRLTRRTY